ncbi:hypothetical protein [Streptomyces sp. NPDC055681]
MAKTAAVRDSSPSDLLSGEQTGLLAHLDEPHAEFYGSCCPEQEAKGLDAADRSDAVLPERHYQPTDHSSE